MPKARKTRICSPVNRRATVVPIESRITILRDQRVIVDKVLAEIYGISVKRLNQQVNRNRDRFPSDFVFRLTLKEFSALRLQIATSNKGRGGRRWLPYAYTEHGAIMAATVLNSGKAVAMSVFVVRAFVRLREAVSANVEFAGKIRQLQKHLETHDDSIGEIISIVNRLMKPPPRRRRKIGFALPPAMAG